MGVVKAILVRGGACYFRSSVYKVNGAASQRRSVASGAR